MREYSVPATVRRRRRGEPRRHGVRTPARRAPDAVALPPAGRRRLGRTSPRPRSPPRSSRWPAGWSRPGSARRPGRADVAHPLRVDAARLRDPRRRRGHRADLRDLVGRAGRVDPVRLRGEGRGRRGDRPSTRATVDAVPTSCPRCARLADRGRRLARCGGGARRRAGALGADADDEVHDAPGAVRRRRPRHAHLHLRHHRPPQGLRADPPQPALRGARRSITVLPELLTGGGSVLLFLPLAHVFGKVIQCAALVHAARSSGHTPDVEAPARRPRDVPARRSCSPCRGCSRRSTTARGSKAARRRQGQDLRRRRGHRGRLERGRATPAAPASGCGCGTPCSTGSSTASCGRRSAGRCVAAVSGGAPLGERLGHFFRGVGVPVLEGYGLTETTRRRSRSTRLAAQRIGTVGRPGARRTPSASPTTARSWSRARSCSAATGTTTDATAEAIDRRLVPHRRHRRARRRRLPARSPAGRRSSSSRPGGKNVAPAVLEDRLRAHPLDQPVHGRRRRAAVHRRAGHRSTPRRCPGWRRAARQAERRRRPSADLVDDPELRAEIAAAVDEANRAVSRAEQIRKFRILPGDFTEEGGELTPTLKVKRVGRDGAGTPTTSPRSTRGVNQPA